MRIGIDVRCFAGGKNTGVEEYTKNFLQALFKHADKNHFSFVLFFNAYKNIEVDFKWIENFDHVELKVFHYPNKILNASFWYLNWPKIDKMIGNIDLFFMPNPTFFALSKNIPLVFTMHDLANEHFKEHFSWKMRIWHWVQNRRQMSKQATKIIAVSQSTAHDIHETYNIKNEKIITLYNGVTASTKMNKNSAALLKIKEKYNLPYKFILSLATMEPRKNIQSIIKAYDLLRQKNPDITHKLVLAGAKGWNSASLKKSLQNATFAKDIICIYDVPSSEREGIYLLSHIFIYPSHFEGFGFPPLEALGSGIPVITSHTTSLPEVVGMRSILIDPTRPEELTYALANVLNDQSLHNELSDKEKALEQMQAFSWKKSVQKLTSLFEEIHT